MNYTQIKIEKPHRFRHGDRVYVVEYEIQHYGTLLNAKTDRGNMDWYISFDDDEVWIVTDWGKVNKAKQIVGI